MEREDTPQIGQELIYFSGIWAEIERRGSPSQGTKLALYRNAFITGRQRLKNAGAVSRRRGLWSTVFKLDWELTSRASPVAQMVQSPPAVQETWGQPLGQEDPLEMGLAAHSSMLAWRIPWTEEPSRILAMGVAKSWTWMSN